MREPFPSQEYITIIDNKERERVQRVEYVVLDVRGEKVYVTADGLAYAEDSLEAKDQSYLIEKLSKLSGILAHPDIVIWDPAEAPSDTLIYYKQLCIAALRRRKLVAAIVKVRRGIKFFYNTCTFKKVAKSRGCRSFHRRRLRSGTSRLGSGGTSSAYSGNER